VIVALSLAVLQVDLAWAERPLGTLETRDGGHVFVFSTKGDSKRPKWMEIEVNNPDGSRRCEWLKKLEPKQAYRFECPVTLAVGDKLPLRVREYNDAGLEDREYFWDPVNTVTAGYLANAKPAPPAGGAITVPDGVIEAAELPLPSTHKPTWYRRINKGFSMRAYENSGDLTIEADALVFVDGPKTVRIPFSQIISVRWEPLDNDMANHWAAVRFTNDEGKEDGVAFRDGGRLGNRQGTGMIYVTLHRAAKK
jgi:hypothetical protein